MIKIYVVWKYSPVTKKESIAGWSRDEKQANLMKIKISLTAEPARTEERIIPTDLVKDLRSIRLTALKEALNNLDRTCERANIKKENKLLVRHELIDSIKTLENRPEPSNYIYDDEVDRYLNAVESGVI